MKQGLYEQIVNNLTRRQLAALDPTLYEIGIEQLDPEEARKHLSTYLAAVTRRALKMIREQNSDDDNAVLMQVQTCNELIAVLRHTLETEELEEWQLDERGEVLTYVYTKLNHIRSIKQEKIVRPLTPLSQSSLFTGSHAEPNMMSELKAEILTADRVDLLVSFIKWSGLRYLMEALETFTANGGQLRVITTTYMEATDYKAVMELSKLPNTNIKVSYDTERTRLHAKAYIFNRETGFTTAYVGSSNLSNPALTSGLEWNIKVTEKDSYDVLQKIEATFESYWYDREFKAFSMTDPDDQTRLKQALNKEKGQLSQLSSFSFTITPYEYQREILEKLEAQRVIYGRTRNLIVAATGVGKTVISAFDYKRFISRNQGTRFLFVAHREEILKQSMDTFRYILKDLNFGELHVGSNQAASLDHLFISIQSLNTLKLTERTTSDFYDYIIVDEFHHAAAPSYQQLLSYYKPKILLGLTATPMRMDGKDILDYFHGTIAAEIRLTDAIDRKLLCPFHYFGVTDSVDLSQVKWIRRGYDLTELANLYTNNKIRVSQVINSLKKYVTDLDDVKALGFCVGVEHASYMAKIFNESGIASIALHGKSSDEERNTAKARLVSGEIKVIFVVDLYNEGVDIPEINTVLFLRPTESLTVFLQQLGRGLRLSDGKECLTVLDFIGQAQQAYSFQEKFRALMGKTKHSVQHYVEHGFSNLPRGSFIQLEKQAKDYVLRNLKQTTLTRKSLIGKLKYFEEDTERTLTLESFIDHYGMTLYDFYGGRNGKRTFYGLMAEAELIVPFEFENKEYLTSRIQNLISINSRRLLHFLITYLEQDRSVETEEDRLMLNMFYYTFYAAAPEKIGFKNVDDAVQSIISCKLFKEEIIEILKYNYAHIQFVDKQNDFTYACPLDLHCSYSMSQVLAAFGFWNEEKAPTFREGVKYFEDKATDIFFITLNKSDKDFSPSTLYEDYAINERLFHWQSQSRISAETPTGQRYIHHKSKGNKIALLVREYKEANNLTSPFVYLGEAEYVSHEGNRPMSLIWRLKDEMPPELVPVANKAIG